VKLTVVGLTAGDCLLRASESTEDGEALLLLLVLAALLVLPARGIGGYWEPPCDEDDEDDEDEPR